MTEQGMRLHRCCFTGHRPEKLTQPETAVVAGLEKEIRTAVADGFTTFISGMARGVDIWAAEIVLRLRKEGQPIRLICASPYEGFERSWSADWQKRYTAIIQAADLVKYINELLEIISSLGGSATIDEIASAYAKKYKMPVSLVSKSALTSTLSKYHGGLRLNHATQKWGSKTETKSPMLYVSEHKYFPSIRDAMSKIFNKSVPMSQGYFSVEGDRMAWFPQPKNEKWDNTLTNDGRFWYERPKTADADYEPDYKIRYIFAHEDQGYRFTGVFKANGIKDGGVREYELIDDKVKIRVPLVICRVTYMKYYDGITAVDAPVNGGSYVSENNDAFEKNNFHRYEDGNCYGFIETKYRSGHTGENEYANSITIESINPMCKGQPSVDGVRVVLAAFSPVLKKNVVVGWYDNATVYRDRVVDGDLIYMTKCRYENAHLIPEAGRVFEIPRGQGNEFGIGQSNFWYIQTKNNTYEFEQELTEYLNNAY